MTGAVLALVAHDRDGEPSGDDGVATDSYFRQARVSESVVCGDCGAVYHDGRWRWFCAPPNAPRTRCSACQRSIDMQPAGYVTIEGLFARANRNEVVRLVRQLEAYEKSEYPLKRIMAIETQAGGLLVTTTDVHLARAIGEGLRHAFQGELVLDYAKDDYLLRVHWRR